MSNLTIRFYSNCLRRYTTFKMYLPCDIRQDWGQTDTKYSENSTKTLFLLHGFTGDAENWVPEYLSDKYNFAVVIPSGENSFWLDGRSTGHQFCKFVGEELVDYVRRVFRLAKDGSETYIMGLSMGASYSICISGNLWQGCGIIFGSYRTRSRRNVRGARQRCGEL